MRMRHSLLSALSLFVMVPGAEDQAIATVADSVFESVRNYGRGRTFVAAYDSDEAIKMNPATLAEGDVTFQLRWAELDLFYSPRGIGEASALSGVSLEDGDDIDDARQAFKVTRPSGRGQLSLFSMRFGFVEVSPFAVGDGFGDLRNPAIPDVSIEGDILAGLNIGMGLAMSKEFSVGITARPFYRWYIGGEYGLVDILEDTDFSDSDFLVSAGGLGIDLGLIWNPGKTFRLGLVVQNLGDTGYFQQWDARPPPIPQRISAGLLWRLPMFGGDLDYLLDVQGILNREGVNLLRIVHTGVELGWSVFSRDHDFGVTAGLNEGYAGGGFFVDAFVARLDFAAYGVEMGQYPGQRPDRRMAFSLRSSMTF